MIFASNVRTIGVFQFIKPVLPMCLETENDMWYSTVITTRNYNQIWNYLNDSIERCIANYINIAMFITARNCTCILYNSNIKQANSIINLLSHRLYFISFFSFHIFRFQLLTECLTLHTILCLHIFFIGTIHLCEYLLRPFLDPAQSYIPAIFTILCECKNVLSLFYYQKWCCIFDLF